MRILPVVAWLLVVGCAPDAAVSPPFAADVGASDADAFVATDGNATAEVAEVSDAVDVANDVAGIETSADASADEQVTAADADATDTDASPDAVAPVDTVEDLDAGSDAATPLDAVESVDATSPADADVTVQDPDAGVGADAPDAAPDSSGGALKCAIDADCDAVPSNGCTAKWMCIVDPLSQIGLCVPQKLLPNGVPCNDGNLCTSDDVCDNGQCLGNPQLCEDVNPCTIDTCVPQTGACKHKPGPTGAFCSDGDRCTVGDLCVAGSCLVGQINACDCASDADCAVQDSADLCTAKHLCVNKFCILGPAPAPCAPSSEPCKSNVCDPTSGKCGLVNFAMSSPCSDGNVCTWPDLCKDGACASTLIHCDDSNPCTDDSCVPGASTGSGAGCKHVNNAAFCDDGDICTSGEHCGSGACGNGTFNTSLCGCDVDADCTALNSQCGGIWHCSNAMCVVDPKTVVKCSTAYDNACQKSVCDETSGQCTFALSPATSACDDGNVCTLGDHCNGAGKCVKTGSLACVDADLCTLDYCAPTVGCLHPFNTAPCDDGDACTTSDRCEAGVCVGNPIVAFGQVACSCLTAVDCAVFDAKQCEAKHTCGSAHVCALGGTPPLNPCTGVVKEQCHVYACDWMTGTCIAPNSPNGLGCSDGDACTHDDMCLFGACLGNSNNCDDGNPCTADGCDITKGCSHVALADNPPCSDGNACTASDTCVNGTCVSGPALSCADGDACTQDGCLPGSGCVHTNGICGDGVCDCGEATPTCAADCVALCGNGVCDGEETPLTCPADCSFLWQRLKGPCTAPGSQDICTHGYVCVARGIAGGGNICVSETHSWLPMPDMRTPTDFVDDGATLKDSGTGFQWAKDTTPVLQWSDALTACTTKSYGGLTDWRLPVVSEFLTLSDVSHFAQKTTVAWSIWPKTNGYVWSATPTAGDGQQAWDFDFQSSSVIYGDQAWLMPVGCVRGGSTGGTGAGSRFAVSADGKTTFDHASGLSWQRTTTASNLTWAQAQALCSNNAAGLPGTGWRLPSRDELLALVDWQLANPAIDATAFPGTASARFLSGTSVFGKQFIAHSTVDFSTGYDGLDIETYGDIWVRCVR